MNNSRLPVSEQLLILHAIYYKKIESDTTQEQIRLERLRP